MPDREALARGSAPERTAPVIWKVVHLAVGAVDHVLLGDNDDDRYRLSVTIIGHGPDAEPDIGVMPVYPCRVCGWAGTCAGGEECHS